VTTWERLGEPARQPARAAPAPEGERVDKQEAWIERTADQLALTLADPSVRAELLTLLAGTKDGRERRRRLEAARRELAAMEITWPLLEEDLDGP
jgi:hypothetical protein